MFSSKNILFSDSVNFEMRSPRAFCFVSLLTVASSLIPDSNQRSRAWLSLGKSDVCGNRNRSETAAHVLKCGRWNNRSNSPLARNHNIKWPSDRSRSLHHLGIQQIF